MRTEPENECEVRDALNALLAERGSAMKVADELGVSNTYISMIRSGKKPVPPKVAEFLGFKRVVRWEQSLVDPYALGGGK